MSVKKQIWLINTLKANPAGLTMGELSALWQESDLNDGRPLSRTTLFRLRDAILSAYGLLIECKRHNGARYHISNPEALNRPTIRNWMLSTLTVSHLLEDSLSLKDRILLENIPSNDATLQLLLAAMKERHRVSFVYRKYTDPSEDGETLPQRVVEPFALKLSQQRWYLLAHNPTRPERPFSVYSLDRIISPAVCAETFNFPPHFDAQAYFSDTFGVMRDESIPPQQILLRAYGTAPAYLRDLPLHSSQREVSIGQQEVPIGQREVSIGQQEVPIGHREVSIEPQENFTEHRTALADAPAQEYADFSLFLRPTPDFINALMSFGPSIKILKPASLAQRLQSRLRATLSRYDTSPSHD